MSKRSTDVSCFRYARRWPSSRASAGYPNATGTTLDLLAHWRRDGRNQALFFAQLEAVETVFFLVEGRADLRQGLTIPPDEPTEEQQAAGARAFLRYACKMATGAGKTTVMGMLAAWSILHTVVNRADARLSDLVLIVCPNVTIHDRLRAGGSAPASHRSALHTRRPDVMQSRYPERLVRSTPTLSGSSAQPCRVSPASIQRRSATST